MSYFADEDLYRRFEKQNYVLSFIYCHGICVYIFSSLSIARLMRRWSSCRRKFHGKGIKWKTFPNDYAASLCGVVGGCSRVESTVPGSNLTVLYILSFFFSCLMHSFPPLRIRIFLFLSYSFGIETINTFIHSCSFFKNHNRFQTTMVNVYTHFRTKTVQKPYPLERHIPVWLI